MRIFASIFLIFTLLVSSIGVSVNKHICEKEGTIVSYFVDIEDCVCDIEVDHACCHKEKTESCHKEPKTKKGCCQEESEFFQLDLDYTTQIEDVSLNPDLLFSLVFAYNILNPSLEVENNKEIENFNHYSPPIPSRDIPVLVQSFLI